MVISGGGLHDEENNENVIGNTFLFNFEKVTISSSLEIYMWEAS